ncbi:MAG: preprotein translocase subunit YajC [Bdellovibrionales bacterium GWA2_49_15]|nr:MAG: preprotein translocase subunit YajC [Bdellovibrionales bacterium GWA2_49_15]HAZ14517.1 preprotein translocase subunit YajC [Bdellovibrionales bacterium]
MFERLISNVFEWLSNAVIASAQAEGAAAAAPAQNPLLSFLPFIVVFFIFYFLMIRPQKKRLQEEQSMLNALAKGDEVFTKSGLLGTIAGMSDKIVTLEVDAGVKLKVLRGHIAGKSTKVLEEGPSPKKEADKKTK